MPAFTLLGPSVIRLPFLLTTSLPHEILHNWWGNGVYVDYSTGNWCEGLTTYLADHWQQKLSQQDANYRLNTLIAYADYVRTGKDFPLRDFKGRNDASSQAVGYGKTMMLFRMLETSLGEDIFKKALQNFYVENAFRVASYADIQRSFEKVSGLSLASEFSQWTERMGAPSIDVADLQVHSWADGSFNVQFELKQLQGDVYDLQIPVRLTLVGGKTLTKLANLKSASQNFSFTAAIKPVKLEIDPDYDVFRSLYTEERPATLSSVLGSAKVHFYYPQNLANANAFVQGLAGAITGQVSETAVAPDFNAELQLDPTAALVLIGDDARFATLMKAQLVGQEFDLYADGIRVESSRYNAIDHSWLVVARNITNPKQVIVWARWAPSMNPGEWAQRLTHYGKFSALIFRDKPNIAKTTWPVVHSPLRLDL